MFAFNAMSILYLTFALHARSIKIAVAFDANEFYNLHEMQGG